MAQTEFKLVRSDFKFRGVELQQKVNTRKSPAG